LGVGCWVSAVGRWVGSIDSTDSVSGLWRQAVWSGPGSDGAISGQSYCVTAAARCMWLMQLLLSVNSISLAFRLLQMAQMWMNSLGVLLITIEKMYEDLLTFFTFAGCITIGFMVSAHFFEWSGAQKEDTETPLAMFWVYADPGRVPGPQLTGLFGMMQETFIFIYMVCGGVVLVNLLIAMMASTYSDIEADSDRQWKLVRAKSIREHHMGDPLPPPFNLIEICFYGLVRLVSAFRSWLSSCIPNRPHRTATGEGLFSCWSCVVSDDGHLEKLQHVFASHEDEGNSSAGLWGGVTGNDGIDHSQTTTWTRDLSQRQKAKVQYALHRAHSDRKRRH